MRNRLRVNVVTANVVDHLYARVNARVLGAALAANLYLVSGDTLAFLFEDRLNVCARAAAERDQQQLHRRGRGDSLVRKACHYCVAARRFAHERFVARESQSRNLYFSI
jgi:hypothetical protein